MWADTLLDLETRHLIRLAVWGAACMLAGTSIITWLTVRRERAPLLRHFAIQTGAWGAVIVAIAAWSARSLELRDFAGVQRLAGFLWLNTGLDAGYAGIGLTLAIAGWTLGKRAGAVGAGIAIVIQGLALLVFDLKLLSAIGPLG